MRNYKPRMKTRLLYLAIGACLTAGAMTIEPAKMFVDNYYGHSFVKQSEFVDTAYDCEIGVFGSAPWRKRGTHFDMKDIARYQEAFRLFGLDEESQKIALQRVMMQTQDSSVFIGNTNIKGEGQFYGAFYSTTYRKDGKSVVCHNARANFRTEGYREEARLFIIQSPRSGEIYYIAEPLACNNISRIYPQIASPYRSSLRSPVYASLPGNSGNSNYAPNANQPRLPPNAIQPPFPYAPVPPGYPGNNTESVHSKINNVPEPPAIALVAVGIIGIIIAKRRNKK